MKFFYFIFLCILSVSCQVRKDYKITGNVQGIPDSSVIDLYVLHEYSGTRVASDTILNGKFSFSDSIGDEVLNMVLSMRDEKKYFGSCNLWVGKANMNVNGSGKYLSAWQASSDNKEQMAENKLLGQTRGYNILIDSLYFLKTQIQQSNKDGKRLIQSKIDSIFKISKVKELAYLKNNYNSLIAVIHLCQFARFGDSLQKAEIRGFYQKIDTTYLNTLWGLGLKSYLNIVIPPKIGDKYVDFKAFDLENKPHQLADFIGKYILLDFWSIGCEPCILSIPEMRLLAANYSNILSLVSVNLDTNRSFWMESSKKENITWTNLSDGKGTFGGAGNAYGVKRIPLYVLINQEGIIVEKWTGFKSGIFEEKLSKYLKK